MAMQIDEIPLTHDDYLIGWVCPLEVEQIAATLMLDRKHPRLPQPSTDYNTYTLGSIYGHNVVIVGLPVAGNNSATAVVTQLRSTFPQIRCGLLVGIGGGVPVTTDQGPIRLGHVVVSKHDADNPGVVQYDQGKAKAGQFQKTGSLAPPPSLLLNAARAMAVDLATSDTDSNPLAENIQRINTRNRRLQRFKFPGRRNDRLFEPDYLHIAEKVPCDDCGCDYQHTINRASDDPDDQIPDDGSDIVVHRGTIASGELVVKDAQLRDTLAKQYGLFCFETEAAGSLTDFPCLVVRGVADYCDTHKNDMWHGYAAATAAAYARNLLRYMPIVEVQSLKVSRLDIREIKSGLNNINSGQQRAELEKWLSCPDPSTNYNEACNTRQMHTCQWVTKTSNFLDWTKTPGSFLWLVGQAGTGKTILSSSVIESISRAQVDEDVIVYFFFDFRDGSKQSFSGMLRSLLLQLSSKSPAVHTKVYREFENHQVGSKQPSDDCLEMMLAEALATFQNVWIVLDALDECQNRPSLLSWLKRFVIQRRESSHIFATSRDEQDIRDRIQPLALSKNIIDLQDDLTKEDVSLYIRSRLFDSADFDQWKNQPHILEMIERNLHERVAQMFRWAACQLDALQLCVDLEQLEAELENMPQTLNEMYERMILNIDSIHRRKAITLLQFLVVSNRPLLLEEAVDVIATSAGKCSFDPKYRMPRSENISRLCPGLVIITHASKSTTDANDREPSITVSLSHFSVKNYLQSDKLHTSIRNDFAEPNLGKIIAKVSLSYLKSLKGSTRGIISRFPWSCHAAGCWWKFGHHANNDRELERLSEQFFEDERLYNTWILVSLESQHRLSRLWIAARAGIVQWVRKSLQDGANIDTVEGSAGTALMAASSAGHQEVVELLLDEGADVNQEWDYDGSTALLNASWDGQQEIVRLLLSRGANINAQRSESGSVLQEAIRSGHRGIVRLLLDKGADVNADCSPLGHALRAASYLGQLDVVELLLNAGAHIDASSDASNDDPTYAAGTALHAASEKDHLEIVQLLLSRGADVNARGGCYETALHAASYKGFKDIVQLLLSHGADANIAATTPSGAWGTALDVAIAQDHPDIVRMLLDSGANMTCKPGVRKRGHTMIS